MIVRAIPSIDELVNEHYKLVADTVRYLRKLPCVRRLGDEAQSVGQFALFKAAKKFDAGTASFRTYAMKSIRRAVLREATKHSLALGVPLIAPDVREHKPHSERSERTLSQSARRRSNRLRKQLGIYD